MPYPPTMKAARLHGPRDIRIENVPHPGPPGPGEALVRVGSVGICGSDMHVFRHARIGDTALASPLILGHEFSGTVEAIGQPTDTSGANENASVLDGEFRPLEVGARVAVDPAFPCGHCEWCERGDPNLCTNLPFCGLWPTDGCLAEWIRVPSKNCFPVPDGFSDAEIALLEPFAIAVHAVDLAHVRAGQSAAVFGAGPVGLCLLEALKAAGCGPIYFADRLDWRLDMAKRRGADEVWNVDHADAVAGILAATQGRGVDIAIEAAHGGEAVDRAAETTALGARLLVVGIDPDDRLTLRHSTARRKGLTITMVRRMKLTYPRAIRLLERGLVNLKPLISHRLPLERTAEAFALNADYKDGVVKAIVEVGLV